MYSVLQNGSQEHVSNSFCNAFSGDIFLPNRVCGNVIILQPFSHHRVLKEVRVLETVIHDFKKKGLLISTNANEMDGVACIGILYLKSPVKKTEKASQNMQIPLKFQIQRGEFFHLNYLFKC